MIVLNFVRLLQSINDKTIHLSLIPLRPISEASNIDLRGLKPIERLEKLIEWANQFPTQEN